MGSELALTGKISSATRSCWRRAVCKRRGDQACWLPAAEPRGFPARRGAVWGALASCRPGAGRGGQRRREGLSEDAEILSVTAASQPLLAKWRKGSGSAAGDHGQLPQDGSASSGTCWDPARRTAASCREWHLALGMLFRWLCLWRSKPGSSMTACFSKKNCPALWTNSVPAPFPRAPKPAAAHPVSSRLVVSLGRAILPTSPPAWQLWLRGW